MALFIDEKRTGLEIALRLLCQAKMRGFLILPDEGRAELHQGGMGERLAGLNG